MYEYDKKYQYYCAKILTEGLNEKDIEEITQLLEKLKSQILLIKFDLAELYSTLNLHVEYNDIMKDNIDFSKLENINLDEVMTFRRKMLSDYAHYQDIMLKLMRICKAYKREVMVPTKKEFLIANTSLVHLVYTNNHNKKVYYSPYDDKFIFNCHFKEEPFKHFIVNNQSNNFFCEDCNMMGDAITYIMEYEHLTYIQAINLLKRIYLIDIDGNSDTLNDPLVRKYRSSLLSSGYYNLLQRGIRDIIESLEDPTKWDIGYEIYNSHLAQIERISENKSIYYEDQTHKDKVLKFDIYS